MPDREPDIVASEVHTPRKSDRVENPQQYATWRDYAFSDNPEEELKLRP